MTNVTTTGAPDPPAAIAEPTPYRIPLPSPSLFDRLEAEARLALEDELEWFSVPGGQVLIEAGDPPDGLYLVLTGLLGIVRGRAGESELMAQVHAGDTVGALALLTAKPNPYAVIALRDTSLVRLNRIAFEKLIRMHPGIALPMTLQVVEHLERALTFQPDALSIPKTVALIPLDAGVRIAWLADALAGALAAAGLRVKVLDEADHDHIEETFYAIEIAHDLVIYRADAHGSSWTRMCIRRSDRVQLVAGATSSPSECLRRLVAAISEVPWRRAELVLLQADGARSPLPAEPWLARLPLQFHCHVRSGRKADISRLGRYLTGGAIGLVLSGGGARGYGHIGVIKAMREAGVEVDLLGGTSIGSIMAAAAALEWDDKEFYERMHRAFVESNPLDYYTVPLVALTRGRKVTARLRANFGEARVEDLWRPFFAVATNLTTGTMAVQRRGPLWRALRASIAIPGLMPPVIEDGQVLADGAVMNNLPTDVMSAMHRGPVVGVDVARHQSLTIKEGNKGRPIRNMLAGPEYDGPGIVSLLLRAGTLGGEAQAMMSQGHADVLLEPPLQDIGIRDWRAFDRAIEIGYRYTMERIGELEKLSRGAADHTPSCGSALGVTPASACRA
jgi:NTE family protein